MRAIFLTVLISLLAGCSMTNRPTVDLIIANATVITAPGNPAQEERQILIRDGRILAITGEVDPQEAVIIDAGGRTVTAGLWNSHVHFMDPALASDPATEIHDMLLQYGFTSVLDTGSDLAATLALSAAIERGQFPGPEIYLANGSFTYTDATPAYLPGYKLPEINEAGQADEKVAAIMNSGAQGIKIFAGSFMSPTKTIHLPPDIILAVSEATHRRGGFVVAHPNDRTGLVNSVENGVDILAHCTPGTGKLGETLITQMLDNDVALIPTLKLWSYELEKGNTPDRVIQAVQGMAVAQLAEYFSAGGEILFGTDTGYMRDFDTREEFVMMQRAGMDFAAILAATTTNPARRFAGRSGELRAGEIADVVVFARDPAADIGNFADVLYTLRAGKPVYCADRGQPGSPCQRGDQ